jgi:hypothetical protein
MDITVQVEEPRKSFRATVVMEQGEGGAVVTRGWFGWPGWKSKASLPTSPMDSRFPSPSF